MTLPLIPMSDDGEPGDIAPCTIDEVRRAAHAYLGARADTLSFGYHAGADAVVVADQRTSRSFLLTAYTMTEGSWQGYLREQLDKLMPPPAPSPTSPAAITEAAPKPHSADPARSQEGRDSQDHQEPVASPDAP